MTDEREKKYSIEVKKPSECARDELQDLAKLITEGGEVARGVEHRLEAADALGLIRYEKEIVGTAALKKPSTRYRKSVFEKAKASILPANFSRELGWIFLTKKHRSKGQMQLLIKALLNVAEAQGVFATTRVSNDKMQRILLSQEFVRQGVPYPSAQNAGEELALYVRPNSSTGRKPKIRPDGN